MLLSVRENLYINLGALGKKFFSWNSPSRELNAAREIANQLRIRPREPEVASGTLSGGNQQKVILGRLLSSHAQVLILEEPTMGVDIGARAEIYKVISDACAQGRTFIIVSSDFEELALICQRVLVIDKGVVAKELIGDEITTDLITHYCSGATEEEKVA
jgi:ribose transport system ATP-binding protein